MNGAKMFNPLFHSVTYEKNMIDPNWPRKDYCSSQINSFGFGNFVRHKFGKNRTVLYHKITPEFLPEPQFGSKKESNNHHSMKRDL